MTPPHPVPAGFAASIFDMDGLLIDSEILWHEAEIEILGGLGVPLAADGCRSTKGMFVGEVTAHWYGLHPWPGATPTPDEVAVTIVDRVIDLIVAKGCSSRAPSTPSTCAVTAACRWRWRRRRSTA